MLKENVPPNHLNHQSQMWALQPSNCDILLKINVVLKHDLRADIFGNPVKEGGHGGEAMRDAGLAAG